MALFRLRENDALSGFFRSRIDSVHRLSRGVIIERVVAPGKEKEKAYPLLALMVWQRPIRILGGTIFKAELVIVEFMREASYYHGFHPRHNSPDSPGIRTFLNADSSKSRELIIQELLKFDDKRKNISTWEVRTPDSAFDTYKHGPSDTILRVTWQLVPSTSGVDLWFGNQSGHRFRKGRVLTLNRGGYLDIYTPEKDLFPSGIRILDRKADTIAMSRIEESDVF